jgi:hypothetical protein
MYKNTSIAVFVTFHRLGMKNAMYKVHREKIKENNKYIDINFVD